jgi:undecaprenyl diphosphate synthase
VLHTNNALPLATAEEAAPMSGIKNQINLNTLPSHIAVIMDGNGRWAKMKGKLRTFGHENGVKSVRETVEACAELGVKYLTLYAFSTENWNRPKFEINALMSLLVSTISKEEKTLMENNIRLQTIGNTDSLPSKVRKELQQLTQRTASNTRMTLVLALSYSSRWELTEAVKAIATQVANGKLKPESISEDIINQNLQTVGMPEPELLIRTSGEHRISNFLLWQISYAELYFTDVLWPDFRKEHLYEAILSYQQRERRFGMTSEQVNA